MDQVLASQMPCAIAKVMAVVRREAGLGKAWAPVKHYLKRLAAHLPGSTLRARVSRMPIIWQFYQTPARWGKVPGSW